VVNVLNLRKGIEAIHLGTEKAKRAEEIYGVHMSNHEGAEASIHAAFLAITRELTNPDAAYERALNGAGLSAETSRTASAAPKNSWEGELFDNTSAVPAPTTLAIEAPASQPEDAAPLTEKIKTEEVTPIQPTSSISAMQVILVVLGVILGAAMLAVLYFFDTPAIHFVDKFPLPWGFITEIAFAMIVLYSGAHAGLWAGKLSEPNKTVTTTHETSVSAQHDS
jgi:hypothetical protein